MVPKSRRLFGIARQNKAQQMVKSWTDKIDNKEVPQLKPSPRTFSDVVEGQSMLVPTASQVDEFMRGIGAEFVRRRRNEEGLPD
jgi:hypothetical protein